MNVDITESTIKTLILANYCLSNPSLMNTSHKRWIQTYNRAIRSNGYKS